MARGPSPPALVAGLAAATAIALAVVARPATALLGDGRLIARNFQLALEGSTDVVVHGAASILAHERVSPLASLLHLAAVRLGGEVGALAVESLALGGLLALCLAGLWWRSRLPVDLKAWVVVLVLGSPTLLLYLGYIENYTAAHLLGGLYVAAACATLAGRLHPGWPTALLLVATGFHLQALAWWPSLAVLWRPAASRPVARAAGPMALLAALPLAALDPVDALLPHAGPGLTLWSPEHLRQWAGGLLLVFPLLPLVPWARWVAARHTLVDLADALLWPSLVLVFFLDPELGAARDWDRLAFLSWPLALTLLLGVHAAGEQTSRRALLPASLVALAATALWVGTHAEARRSAAWVQRAVEADPHAHEHGFEALAEYHAAREQWPVAARSATAAWESSGNPRLAVLAAQHHLRTGAGAEARRLLEEALRRQPADHRVRHELLRQVARDGDEGAVLALAAEGMRLHPHEPVYPYFAGEGELRRGRLPQAHALFRHCLRLPGLPEEARRYAQAVLGEGSGQRVER